MPPPAATPLNGFDLPLGSLPSPAGRPEMLQSRHRELAHQILDLGPISQGSVVLRHTYCRTPDCRCHADPPQPHGPYWQWTRYDSGRPSLGA
jgi:hypothetical protein